MIVRGDAVRLPFKDKQFDLCCGSPPYLEARLYLENGEATGIARGCREWVEWMLVVTTECLRVTKGPVIWVVAGTTRDRNYQPGPEGLLWRWWDRGGECHCLRPVFWNRSGIPGSGGDQWYRNDVEYCLCFKRPGKLPFADPKANGHRPKWGPGGEMSHRNSSGMRVNQWGNHSIGTAKSVNGKMVAQDSPSHNYQSRRDLAAESDADMFGEPVDEPAPKIDVGGGHDGMTIGRYPDGRPMNPTGKAIKDRGKLHTKRMADGEMADQFYEPPVIANPGNLLRTTNGGGSLGHAMAHANEAPYSVKVPKFFIASHCPPSGLCLDPFVGGGTTLQAAAELGRRCVGLDLRQSQCTLSRRRLLTITSGFAFTFDFDVSEENEIA